MNASFDYWLLGSVTALEVAANEGRLDKVHLLLRAGADLHLPKRKRRVRAAELAERWGYVAIASSLRDWKDDENLETLLGDTVAQPAEESRVVELD